MQFPTESQIAAKARDMGLIGADDPDTAVPRNLRARVVDALLADQRPKSEPPEQAELVSRTIVPTGDGKLMVEVWHLKE